MKIRTIYLMDLYRFLCYSIKIEIKYNNKRVYFGYVGDIYKRMNYSKYTDVMNKKIIHISKYDDFLIIDIE